MLDESGVHTASIQEIVKKKLFNLLKRSVREAVEIKQGKREPSRVFVVIQNEDAQARALDRINKLMDAKPGTKRGRELERLVDAVVRYETPTWPMK